MIIKSAFMPTLAVAATSLTTLLIPTEAMALTFNWSFVTDSSSTGGAGQTVSGTISGLVEGSNNGTGLTVTVDSTPTGLLTGDSWTFVQASLGGDAFTVTGGNVTFADAFFISNSGNNELYFGGFGIGYSPALYGGTISWVNLSAPNNFTPANTPTPTTTPEPGSAVALLGLGLGLVASKRKKQG